MMDMIRFGLRGSVTLPEGCPLPFYRTMGCHQLCHTKKWRWASRFGDDAFYTVEVLRAEDGKVWLHIADCDFSPELAVVMRGALLLAEELMYPSPVGESRKEP